jgi:L-serine deaminase
MYTEEVMKKRKEEEGNVHKMNIRREQKMKGEEQEEYDSKRYIRAIGDAMKTFRDIMEDREDE